MRRFFTLLTVLALLLVLAVPAAAAFPDVPSGSALAGEVGEAVEYGLMTGYANGKFGYADSMTRAQFVTVLGRMLGWTADAGTESALTGAMKVSGLAKAYRTWVALAAERGVVDTGTAFRPSDAVTRAEMAELLVRALGYRSLAESLNSSTMIADSEYWNGTPFEDLPAQKEGYIGVAYAIGMTKGTSATTFSPGATATRAQAAAMLVRMYKKLHQEISWSHAFYAISSYSQLALTGKLDAVSAGWSRMTWDGSSALLSTTSANGNEYCIPAGYGTAVSTLKGQGTALNLSVYMDVSGGVRELLASEAGRVQAVSQIVGELTASYASVGENPYDGVTIDFEGLRSAQKADFSAFLTALSAQVKGLGKTLYVCVSPLLTTGSSYDGYDYRTIGTLADKVILMAYDYDARDLSGYVGTEYYKTAAPAPLGQVYASLLAITDSSSGVSDVGKIALGYSCKNVAWKIDASGRLLSGTPAYPSNDTVAARLAQSDTVLGWSDTYQCAYAVYTTEDGGRYFLWYDSQRSVESRLELAKLLGVTGVSLWRLGIVPDYSNWSWSTLLA